MQPCRRAGVPFIVCVAEANEMKSIRTLLIDGPNHRLGLIGLACCCLFMTVRILAFVAPITGEPSYSEPIAGQPFGVLSAGFLIGIIFALVGAILVSIYFLQWCWKILQAVVSATNGSNA